MGRYVRSVSYCMHAHLLPWMCVYVCVFGHVAPAKSVCVCMCVCLVMLLQQRECVCVCVSPASSSQIIVWDITDAYCKIDSGTSNNKSSASNLTENKSIPTVRAVAVSSVEADHKSAITDSIHWLPSRFEVLRSRAIFMFNRSRSQRTDTPSTHPILPATIGLLCPLT
jgi:hypothetical protein